MTEQQRVACWAQMQRELYQNAIITAGMKTQWRTLLNTLDDFLDANAVAINSTIPQPERSTFTAKEKAFAMMLVIAHRYLAS